MAWTCSGRTNAELIDKLVHNKLITSTTVADAMRRVDRKHYVRAADLAYEDSPQSIGFGATISAPHMHAHACENLLSLIDQANGDSKGAILDVGCGSGYLTAVLHRLAPNATVVGIDHISGLTDLSRANLRADGVQVDTANPKVVIVTGDGRKGYPEHAPYQAIHVGAAAPEIPPELVTQLARPGRMFIPVGTNSQDIWQIDKSAEGVVTEKKLFSVRYVPLTDPQSQWRGS